MPENSIQITNLNDGETIPTSYTLDIEYFASGAGTTASITVDASNGTPAHYESAYLQCGQLLIYNQGITFAAPTTTSVTATLNNSEGPLTSDGVNNVVVSNKPVVTIDPIAPPPPGPTPLTTPAPSPVTGTYDPTKGTKVLLLIESRKSGDQRRQLVFADYATVDSTKQKWTHPAVGHKGSYLLAVLLDSTGNIVAMVRAALK